MAPASATVDHNDLCPSTGNIVLTYSGGTLGTNATAEWYSDAAFTTNVGSGNNLTLATPNATTTYYVRFEGDCNTTAAQSVTVNIKDISVAPASATVDHNNLCPADGNIVLSLHRRNPWHERHGRMVQRCSLHNQCRLGQQPDSGHPSCHHNVLCPL